MSINGAEWENSWICSPWTHYISYAREEVSRAAGPLSAIAANSILGALGICLKQADFNRVVMINNWLLSTTPWPAWDAENLPFVIDAITERWPDHALVFRSLNPKESVPLMAALSK